MKTKFESPVPIGVEIKPWGKVVAVGCLPGGERYYWMLCARGGISMMPADVVESPDRIFRSES